MTKVAAKEPLGRNSPCDDIWDARQIASHHPPFGEDTFEKSFVEVGQTTQEGSFSWVDPKHHSM